MSVGIVYAEEDPAVRQMYARQLESDGFEVRTASDGAEALAVIRQRCPDVVLTSIAMATMDGIQLAKEILNDEELDPAVIFLAPRTPSGESIEILSDDSIQIPCEPAELTQRIRLVLERRRNERTRVTEDNGVTPAVSR